MSAGWRRFVSHRLAVVGLALIALLILLAAFAAQVAPRDPIRQDLPSALAPPSREFPLGADEFGRCILSRILYGARLSLVVGVLATAVGAVTGILLGLLAGYFPRLDAPVMRAMEVLLAFPSILLAIAIVAALGPSLVNVMIAVGLRSIPSFARLTRSMVLSLKELEFVQGVHALGAGHGRVLFRHILPNSVSPLLVFSSMQVATSILLAAILSFPGPGRAAAHAGVGEDGERRAGLPAGRSARVVVPGDRDLPDRDGLQLPGRRIAGRARSPDASPGERVRGG